MAVSWYETNVYKMVSPDDSKTMWGTKITNQWIWEMWTVTDETGAVTQIPQQLRPKYVEVHPSVVYNEPPTDENLSTNVALVRVECPDGSTDPIVENTSDYLVNLVTQEQWDTQMAKYPNLKACFTDQPYYPKTA